MTHTVCAKLTDSEVMEMVFTHGAENLYANKCHFAANVPLSNLHKVLHTKSYVDVWHYRDDQLEGCQHCHYYKGDYPELKIKE